MRDIVFQETPIVEDIPKDYSPAEKINALLGQNVTMFTMLNRTDTGTTVDKDFSFSKPESIDILNKNNIATEDYDKYLDSTSLYDLTKRIERDKEVRQDAEIVSSMGALGVAGSIGASLLDPVGGLIGFGAGKAVLGGAKAVGALNTSPKLLQALGGATGAIGATTALELSLDNELTPTQLAVNGTLGFAIGFATANKHIGLTPETRASVDNINTNGAEIVGANDSSKLFSFMHSSADNLSTSSNPVAQYVGKKIARSMRDVGLQADDVADDIRTGYSKQYNKAVMEFNDYTKKYKETTGLDFTPADEKNIIHYSHKISNEYDNFKNAKYKEILDTNKDSIAKEIQSFKDSYTHTLTQKGKPTKQSIRELEAKVKELDTQIKDNYKAEAIKLSQAKLDRLKQGVPEQYKDGVNLTSNYFKSFGKDIKESDLNGYKNLDDSFYFTRDYNIDKITKDPEGATLAMKNAMIKSSGATSPKALDEIELAAKEWVNKVTATPAQFQTIDTEEDLIKALESKISGTSGYMKGRKLKIDASDMIDYLNLNLLDTMNNYTHKVGGELALKRSLGIDSRYDVNKFISDNKFAGKDAENIRQAVDSIKGTTTLDPRANSAMSKTLRGFNHFNYFNFGGWFGLNTLTDLANITYDFGLGKTMKYATSDIIGAIKGSNNRQSKAMAKYLGLAAESLTHERATMMGQESFTNSKAFKGEETLHKLSGAMSKYSGLNMVIDFMDRVVSMSATDYILTAKIDKKFTKTMNRLGISQEEVMAIRNSGVATFDKLGFIDKVNFDVLDNSLKAKMERALVRASEDTVIKGNEINTPAFLTDFTGNVAVDKALFQFMKMPVIAYNKLGVKMAHNWDTVDAMVATGVAASIIALGNQAKDIGRVEPRFDLDTDEGIKNNIISIVERVPHLSAISIPQSYVDILGHASSIATGTEYKGKADVNLGITMDRVKRLSEMGSSLLQGEFKTNDIMTAKSFVPYGNMFYLQPFSNMINDEIKGTVNSPTKKTKVTKEDIEKYLSGE